MLTNCMRWRSMEILALFNPWSLSALSIIVLGPTAGTTATYRERPYNYAEF